MINSVENHKHGNIADPEIPAACARHPGSPTRKIRDKKKSTRILDVFMVRLNPHEPKWRARFCVGLVVEVNRFPPPANRLTTPNDGTVWAAEVSGYVPELGEKYSWHFHCAQAKFPELANKRHRYYRQDVISG
ncbi:hypothetical protein PG985_006942 [Apiospora marii]|uniref:Uncharacterized protein n=1 Tax=Apiospora marii TaxID=335849 RepID=A0ABR1SFG3_9PEZI